MMAGLLERNGFIIVSKIENADLIIINTCTVKHATENKIIHRITELTDKKLIIAVKISLIHFNNACRIPNKEAKFDFIQVIILFI